MNKLLTANFFRMFKNKLFWAGILFMAAVGIGFPLVNYNTMIKNDYPLYLDSIFFMGAAFIVVVLSIFCSLFLGTEYSDGTIRNKMIAGQKRTVIYLANLFTCILAGILMCGVCLVVGLCAGLPLLGSFQNEWNVLLPFILCIFFLSMAFSSLFTFIAMTCKSKASSAVICILTAFILIFAATYIQAQLSEPEIYDSYIYMDETGNIVTEEAEPNPNYIRGTKREIYKFLNDFLPGGQSFQIAQMSTKHPYLLLLYSGILIITTTGTGILIFRQKDLN